VVVVVPASTEVVLKVEALQTLQEAMVAVLQVLVVLLPVLL
jgi:hypothetical protein